MTPTDTERALDPRSWPVATWAWVAAAVAVVVYLPSLWNGFAYDDTGIILNNTRLHDWTTLPDALTAPWWPEGGEEAGLWRPTSTLALALLWQISGGAAVVFHAANVLLHACVSFMVVRVASALLPAVAAGVAGVFFAVHPVHVEAVANGVGIAELLAAAFTLAALWVVVRRPTLGAAGIAMVLGLFALGFGAKESAVVLPGLVFVVDAVRLRLRVRDLWRWLRLRGVLLVGFLAVIALMFRARIGILGGMASARPPMGADLLTEVPRIWTLGEIWYQMLRVLTVPTWLSPDYSPDLIRVVVSWTPRGTAGAIGVLAVLAGAWWCARRMGRRGVDAQGEVAGVGETAAVGVAFGVAWFVVAVSPVSNVVVLTGVLMAERTLYLPSVGVAVAMSAVVTGVLIRMDTPRVARSAVVVVTAFLLMAWTTRTVTYIPVWRDNQAVFGYMASYLPDSVRGQLFRADHLADMGDMEAALRHYRAHLRRASPTFRSLVHDGLVALNRGRYDVARLFLVRAAALRPDDPTPRILLADLALRRGRWPEAERWARGMTAADSAEVAGWQLLSSALAGQERWTSAAAARRRVAELDTVAWQPWLGVAEYRALAGDTGGAQVASDSARARTDDPAALARIDSVMTAVGVAGGR